MWHPTALGRLIPLALPAVAAHDLHQVVDRVFAVSDHLDLRESLLLNPPTLVLDRAPVTVNVILLDRLTPVSVVDLLDAELGRGVEVDEHQRVSVSELEEQLERGGHDQTLE